MEASVAAGQAQGGEAQAAQAGEGEAAPAQDFGQLQQTLEALAGGQEELRQFLQTNPALQPQQEAEEAGDEFDLSFLDLDSPTFDPTAVADGITGLVDRAAEQKIQSALQPLAKGLEQVQSERAEDKRAAEAHALVQEFPELGQVEVAQEVVKTSRAYAEANFPPEVAKALGDSPAFWRAIYMAGRAADAANAEGADVPTAVLEGGSGARPGAGPSEMDQLGDQIVSGHRGSSVLPFG